MRVKFLGKDEIEQAAKYIEDTINYEVVFSVKVDKKTGVDVETNLIKELEITTAATPDIFDTVKIKKIGDTVMTPLIEVNVIKQDTYSTGNNKKYLFTLLANKRITLKAKIDNLITNKKIGNIDYLNLQIKRKDEAVKLFFTKRIKSMSLKDIDEYFRNKIILWLYLNTTDVEEVKVNSKNKKGFLKKNVIKKNINNRIIFSKESLTKVTPTTSKIKISNLFNNSGGINSIERTNKGKGDFNMNTINLNMNTDSFNINISPFEETLKGIDIEQKNKIIAYFLDDADTALKNLKETKKIDFRNQTTDLYKQLSTNAYITKASNPIGTGTNGHIPLIGPNNYIYIDFIDWCNHSSATTLKKSLKEIKDKFKITINRDTKDNRIASAFPLQPGCFSPGMKINLNWEKVIEYFELNGFNKVVYSELTHKAYGKDTADTRRTNTPLTDGLLALLICFDLQPINLNYNSFLKGFNNIKINNNNDDELIYIAGMKMKSLFAGYNGDTLIKEDVFKNNGYYDFYKKNYYIGKGFSIKVGLKTAPTTITGIDKTNFVVGYYIGHGFVKGKVKIPLKSISPPKNRGNLNNFKKGYFIGYGLADGEKGSILKFSIKNKIDINNLKKGYYIGKGIFDVMNTTPQTVTENESDYQIGCILGAFSKGFVGNATNATNNTYTNSVPEIKRVYDNGFNIKDLSEEVDIQALTAQGYIMNKEGYDYTGDKDSFNKEVEELIQKDTYYKNGAYFPLEYEHLNKHVKRDTGTVDENILLKGMDTGTDLYTMHQKIIDNTKDWTNTFGNGISNNATTPTKSKIPSVKKDSGFAEYIWFLVFVNAETSRHPCWNFMANMALEGVKDRILQFSDLTIPSTNVGYIPKSHGAVKTMEGYKDRFFQTKLSDTLVEHLIKREETISKLFETEMNAQCRNGKLNFYSKNFNNRKDKFLTRLEGIENQIKNGISLTGREIQEMNTVTGARSVYAKSRVGILEGIKDLLGNVNKNNNNFDIVTIIANYKSFNTKTNSYLTNLMNLLNDDNSIFTEIVIDTAKFDIYEKENNQKTFSFTNLNATTLNGNIAIYKQSVITTKTEIVKLFQIYWETLLKIHEAVGNVKKEGDVFFGNEKTALDNIKKILANNPVDFNNVKIEIETLEKNKGAWDKLDLFKGVTSSDALCKYKTIYEKWEAESKIKDFYNKLKTQLSKEKGFEKLTDKVDEDLNSGDSENPFKLKLDSTELDKKIDDSILKQKGVEKTAADLMFSIYEDTKTVQKHIKGLVDAFNKIIDQYISGKLKTTTTTEIKPNPSHVIPKPKNLTKHTGKMKEKGGTIGALRKEATNEEEITVNQSGDKATKIITITIKFYNTSNAAVLLKTITKTETSIITKDEIKTTTEITENKANSIPIADATENYFKRWVNGLALYLVYHYYKDCHDIDSSIKTRSYIKLPDIKNLNYSEILTWAKTKYGLISLLKHIPINTK